MFLFLIYSITHRVINLFERKNDYVIDRLKTSEKKKITEEEYYNCYCFQDGNMLRISVT